MITCQRCGKDNQDHYKFCLGCGAEITAPPKQDGNVAMMKTMMADVGQSGTIKTPTPPVGVPAQGLPGMPTGPSAPMAQQPPARPPQGMGGPAGPMGAPPPGGAPMGAPPPGGAPMGAPPPGGAPMGAPPIDAPPPGAPPMGASPPGAPPQGALPMGASPPGAPPQGALPMGAPPQGMHGMGAPAGPPPGVPTGTNMASPPMAAASAAGPRLCTNCSTEIPPAFKFCGACGTPTGDSPPPRATADIAQQPDRQASPRATMTLIRPDGSEGGTHALKEGENKIGRDHADIFTTDGYLSPTHAEIILNAAGAVVRDLDSLNGVFARMTDEEEVLPGQIIRLGQELLRFDPITPPEPLEDGTEVMGSPNPGFWGKITVIIGNDVDGSAYPLLGDSVTMGRERGDINFPDDGYVSGLHARMSTRDGKVYLVDLGSSNGTFMKVQGEREIHDQSFVLLGQQLFRIEIK